MMDDQDLERYRRGRNGDHIMGVPFSCELCHFRNVNLRDPLLDSSKDVYTLTAMRRANIDVCWAREPSTVRANLNRARRDFFETEEHCTIEHQSLPFLPDPDLKDKVGMRHALRVLQASLRSGRYTQNVQFETVRKTEAWIGNMHDAGEGYRGTPVGDGGGLEDKRGSSCETRGRWFRRFMRGVKLRMGQVRYQNEPITSEIILELDAIISAEWRETVDEERKEHLEELMCFILIGYACSLRGEEVPLVSLKGMLKFWEETWAEPDPYIMVALYGRFKGETGFRWHCLPVSDKTRSGLPVRRWVSTLLWRRKEVQGRTNGWLFVKEDGKTRAQIRDYDSSFLHYLELAKSRRPGLFSAGTLMHMFSLVRSLRRGAVLATAGKVSSAVVNLINRWRTKEGAKGTAPGLTMEQTYTNVRDAIPVMIAFSAQL